MPAILLSLLAAMPARAQQGAPVPSIPLPPQVDLIDDYEGQRLCDPTPKPGTLRLRDLLWQTYGRGIWAGISRDCNVSWDRGISEHKDGRAIDWGVSVRKPTKAQGDAFVSWATANNGENARRLGIMYIIWDSRMWRLYDMGRGWSEYNRCLSVYTSPSYDTTCHRDHVHISMTWHGAGAWTSWYDGTAVTEPTCRAGDPVPAAPGSPQQPAVVFEPLRGIGTPSGQRCYLGSSIQTLKVPTSSEGLTIQRLQIDKLATNAPSPVRIWTNAGSSASVSRSDRFPRTLTLDVARDGLIYLQQPIGQAGLQVQALGQVHPVAAGQTIELQVAGEPTGVPANAKAVALNLTVTEPRTAGFLRIFPCGGAMPGTSNINFAANQTISNSVVAPVGEGGRVCIHASATTHVIVDFSGFFPAKSSLTTGDPSRLVDTRTEPRGLAAGVAKPVRVPGGKAVFVSLAVTEPVADGWLAVYPCDRPWQGTSNVNFRARQTIAASALVAVARDSTICLLSNVATHAVVDLMGTLTSDGGFEQFTPVRITDTRAVPGSPLPAMQILRVTPKPAGPTVALNLTSTGSAGPGWLQAFPCDGTPPITSTVNFPRGETLANSALVKTGADGTVCIRGMTSTHVVVDQSAVLGPETFKPFEPRRLLDTRER